MLNLDDNSYTAPGKSAVKLPADMSLRLTTAEQEVTGGNSGGIRFFADGSSTGGHISVHAGSPRVAHQRRLADRRHRARRASPVTNSAREPRVMMVMKRARTPIARNRQAGFSLIEMVAAFLVFAIGIGVLMQVLATSMHSTRASSDYTMAALWAAVQARHHRRRRADRTRQHERPFRRQLQLAARCSTGRSAECRAAAATIRDGRRHAAESGHAAAHDDRRRQSPARCRFRRSISTSSISPFRGAATSARRSTARVSRRCAR